MQRIREVLGVFALIAGSMAIGLLLFVANTGVR